jgi:hypothetical protein
MVEEMKIALLKLILEGDCDWNRRAALDWSKAYREQIPRPCHLSYFLWERWWGWDLLDLVAVTDSSKFLASGAGRLRLVAFNTSYPINAIMSANVQWPQPGPISWEPFTRVFIRSLERSKAITGGNHEDIV